MLPKRVSWYLKSWKEEKKNASSGERYVISTILISWKTPLRFLLLDNAKSDMKNIFMVKWCCSRRHIFLAFLSNSLYSAMLHYYHFRYLERKGRWHDKHESHLPLFFLWKTLKVRVRGGIIYNVPYAPQLAFSFITKWIEMEYTWNLYYSIEIEPDTYK